MRWKQWPLYKFMELCNRIYDELADVKIILHGSPTEKEMIEKSAVKMKGNPIIAAGQTNIRQAAALIEKSDLIVCNDSGLMHVAVAVNTPVVAIYGPTDYTRTAPFGKKHKIIRKELECSPCFKLNGSTAVENCKYKYKCLLDINVSEVINVIKKQLKV